MKLFDKVRLRCERREEFESQWLREYFFRLYQSLIRLFYRPGDFFGCA